MKRLIVFILISFFSVAKAQDYIGIRQSNYAGVTALSYNPAFMADNRLQVDVSIFSVSVTGYNNYLYFNPNSMPYGWVKTFNVSGNNNVESAIADYNDAPFKVFRYDDDLNQRQIDTTGYYKLNEFENPDKLARNLFYNHEFSIFNALVCLDDDIAFSFGIKQRSFVNADNISYDVLDLIETSLKDPDTWNEFKEDQGIKLSMHHWNEFFVGLGSVLVDEKQHYLKTGVTLKLIQGLGAIYLSTDNLEFDLLNDDTATVINGDFHYGYSDNLESANTNGAQASLADYGLSYKTPFNGQGFGFGIDIGFVYEWRPKYESFKHQMDGESRYLVHKNKYRMRAALSFNDIGGVRYKKGDLVKDFNINNNNLPLDLGFLTGTQELGSFAANIENLGFPTITEIPSKETFFMNLPTHITANLDFLIYKDFYINAGTLLAFGMNNNENRSRYHSSFTITPRLDNRFLGVSLPFTYSAIYGARVGAGFRFGPVIVGTSNFTPFFQATKDKQINGADIYAAIKIPVSRLTPKDSDKDMVSDRLDLCKETPGVWKFKGCPDSDNDGVQDSEDRCPSEKGSIEFKGCPDSDGDKIIDMRDDCPDTPGELEFNGCPDTDTDGIMDSKDDCPNIAGLEEFNGCPDTDGDGIKDSEDLCPQAAGPKENSGCPDTDGDGIFDYLDGCPIEVGPKENHGCPWPDTDEDGILDKDDQCPNNAGPKANKGCPYIDTDGDGILDKDDNCVNVVGPITNFGCPVINEVEKEIINTAFENLEFETGKAIIKDASYESLDELAKLLERKGEWKIEVSGHTDSQGGDQNNLILSKKRAEAIQSYLVDKGIDSARIIVEYYGELKPIADNETPEGRQLNRRVEMKIIFE